jgi:hypothetical protein
MLFGERPPLIALKARFREEAPVRALWLGCVVILAGVALAAACGDEGGGAAAASATGAQGSGGSSGCSEAEPACDKCMQTACARAACRQEVEACEKDPNCKGYLDCTAKCRMDVSCFDKCAMDFSAGLVLVSPMQLCLACEPAACAKACKESTMGQCGTGGAPPGPGGAPPMGGAGPMTATGGVGPGGGGSGGA